MNKCKKVPRNKKQVEAILKRIAQSNLEKKRRIENKRKKLFNPIPL